MIFFAACLAVFMVSVEATIVATAIPTIVGDLGGLRLLQLGVRHLFPDPSRDDSDLRPASRLVRPQKTDRRVDQPVPHRLDPQRLRARHGHADRLSRPARARCGRRDAARDHDRRRHLHRARAGQGPRLSLERVGHLGGQRPAAGRVSDRARRLADDLLDQRALRHPVHRGHPAVFPRTHRTALAPHRLRRLVALGRAASAR